MSGANTMHKSLLHFIALIIVPALGSAVLGCGGSASDHPAIVSGSTEVDRLEVIDTVEGSGATAAVGHSISVFYEGWLYDVNTADLHGAQFDSNIGGTPFAFHLGAGEVISGWDQGLVGMRVGGERTLIIPSGLAFGALGSGPIPPNRAVVFDVKLVSVD